LVPIVVDTDDPAIIAAVATALQRPVVARKGSKGFVGFYRDSTGLIAAHARKTSAKSIRCRCSKAGALLHCR